MEAHNEVAQIQNIYNTYVLLMQKPVCEKGEPERLMCRWPLRAPTSL